MNARCLGYIFLTNINRRDSPKRSLTIGVDVRLVGVRALSLGVEVEGVVEDGRHAAGHET